VGGGGVKRFNSGKKEINVLNSKVSPKRGKIAIIQKARGEAPHEVWLMENK